MIDLIKQHIEGAVTPGEKLNRAREMLQFAALKIMYDKGQYDHVAFTGGTALRVLYDLRRFSEDLDFSLVDADKYEFKHVLNDVIVGFKQYGLVVEADPKTKKTVHGAMLKFKGLLKELGLSPMASQNLLIKIEIDSNPPKGGKLESAIVNKLFMFSVRHFDLASMFATKLHACFYRKYVKGRDFYDFIWYLSRKTVPNFILLNNAITQTQGANPGIDGNNLAAFLMKKIRGIDFSIARKDVEGFLEDKNELKLLDLKLLEDSINNVYGGNASS